MSVWSDWRTWPTTVYRCYDIEGRLLYIGATGNLKRRCHSHRYQSPWWHQVATITSDVRENRAEAFKVERLAIVAENPLYNQRRHYLRQERAA